MCCESAEGVVCNVTGIDECIQACLVVKRILIPDGLGVFRGPADIALSGALACLKLFDSSALESHCCFAAFGLALGFFGGTTLSP